MPRLDAVFERAIDRPATFFVAGAGFGKTTNVSAFLQKGGTRFVWLTLDPLDREEGRVVDYLVAAAAQEINGTVLHYDADYDLLAEVMDFESAWLAPPGSLP